MPGNKKPKKKYVKKIVYANTIEIAVTKRALVSKANQEDWFGPVQAAFEAMQRGTLDKEGWVAMSNGLNVAFSLGQFCDIGPNLLPEIKRGQDALLKVGVRLHHDGRVTCWALEMALIREALDLFKIQLSLCTNGELTKALKHANDPLGHGARQVTEQEDSITRPD